MNNGGFDQYFFNSSGDHAFLAPTALKMVGAKTMASIVMSAIEVFGPAGPARDRSVRQSQLLSLPEGSEDTLDALDRAFYENPDDVAELVLRYLEAHAPDLLLDVAES